EPVAFDLNGPALRFHEMSGDEEAQAEAADGPRRRAVTLAEPVEHVGEECRFDAVSCVGDAHGYESSNGHRVDSAPPARRRELHGVRQQIQEDLLDAARIRDDAEAGR